jgi:hypothetical protein
MPDYQRSLTIIIPSVQDLASSRPKCAAPGEGLPAVVRSHAQVRPVRGRPGDPSCRLARDVRERGPVPGRGPAGVRGLGQDPSRYNAVVREFARPSAVTAQVLGREVADRPGGHMEDVDDTPEQSVARELREELGPGTQGRGLAARASAARGPVPDCRHRPTTRAGRSILAEPAAESRDRWFGRLGAGPPDPPPGRADEGRPPGRAAGRRTACPTTARPAPQASACPAGRLTVGRPESRVLRPERGIAAEGITRTRTCPVVHP